MNYPTQTFPFTPLPELIFSDGFTGITTFTYVSEAVTKNTGSSTNPSYPSNFSNPSVDRLEKLYS